MGAKRTQKQPPKSLPTLDITLNSEQIDGYNTADSSTVTYINGKAGSGKTLLALHLALDYLHGNKIDTILSPIKTCRCLLP